MLQKSYEKSENGTLYIVPTPIGNIDDITIRGKQTLESVDYILAEDTRETSKLLNQYNIKKRLIACHKYNENKIKDKVLLLLKNRNNIALVTDRGTPLISDPGYIISKYCADNCINVVALPGATALLPALNMSCISGDKFLFYGFLSSKNSESVKELTKLLNFEVTVIIYESPYRLERTLKNIKNISANRNISIVREISKLHEEVFRGTVDDAILKYSNVKGEIVIVIEKSSKKELINQKLIDKEANEMINNNFSYKDVVRHLSKKYNIPKNLLYNKIERKNK